MKLAELQQQIIDLEDTALDTTRLSGKAALPVLVEYAGSENPDQRALAVECFGEIEDDNAVLAIAGALDDGEPDVWNTALNVLHEKHNPILIPKLEAVLLKSANNELRAEGSARLLRDGGMK